MSGMQSKLEASESYRLDDQVGFILRRASQRHLTIFADLIGDLTSTQFAALAKLYEVGPVSQNELGRQTAMDGATIKGVIDRLRKRGYVETRPDGNDRRRIFVELSDAGTKIYQDCEETAFAISAKTLAPLTPKETAVFLDLLRKLT